MCFSSCKDACFVRVGENVSEEKHKLHAVVHVAEMGEFVEKQGLERGAVVQLGGVVGGLATADSDLDIVGEGGEVQVELELESAGIGSLGPLRMAFA